MNTPIEMRVVLPVGLSADEFAEVFCAGRVVRTVEGSGAPVLPGVAAAITEYRLLPGHTGHVRLIKFNEVVPAV